MILATRGRMTISIRSGSGKEDVGQRLSILDEKD